MTNDDHPSGAAGSLLARLDRVASSPWSAGVAIACIGFLILLTSLQRTHFNMGVETDFTGSFGPDAVQVLAGEPLRLPFHPAGYPLAAALAKLLSGSWLAGGLWISGLSALIVLAAGFLTFRRLAGVAASWGVLIASVCSTTFLAFSSIVSSDMLFAAAVTVMLALVVSAMLEPHRTGLWLCSGIAAACVVLTRTNGLAAFAALAAPMFLSASLGNRLRSMGMVALGLAVPLLLWGLYATATDSPFAAAGNHLNLAVAAYGDETKSWAEDSPRFVGKFDGMLEVVAHDPLRFATHLVKRVLMMPPEVALKLSWPVLSVFAALGLILMLWKRRTRALLAYLLVIGAIAALIAIVEFRARYFLFLLPLIGAMAAVAFREAVRKLMRSTVAQALTAVVAAGVVTIVAARAHAPVQAFVEQDGKLEADEALPQLQRQTEADALIFARKSSLAFEAGRPFRQLANVSDLNALLQSSCTNVARGQPAYLFVGMYERKDRPDFVQALAATGPVAWLEPVAKGQQAEWRLYRIQLDEDPAFRGRHCDVPHEKSGPGD